MKQAPRGYYRSLLSATFPNVRIALTNQPMIGVTEVPKEPIIEELKKSTDEYAEWYINGLQNGSMATIIETPIGGQQYWRPGELYLKS